MAKPVNSIQPSPSQHPTAQTDGDRPSSGEWEQWRWQDALRPATIRQLLEAELQYANADFKINGHEVKNVTAVAQVIDAITTNQSESIRRVQYILEDGTSGGRINAFHQLFEPDVDLPYLPPEYVRVTGTLFKSPGFSRTSLRITHINKVTDMHEVFFHLLQSMTVTLSHKRGNPPSLYKPSQPIPTQNTQMPSTQTVIPSTSPILITLTATEDSISSSAASSPSSYATADSGHEYSPLITSIPLIDLGPPEIIHAPAPSPVRTLQRDPYSHLTTLQRDIILQLCNACGYDENSRGITATTIVIGLRRSRAGLSGTLQPLRTALDVRFS